MYLKELHWQAIEEIKEVLIDYIENLPIGEILPDLLDIHRRVYNADYFIIGTAEAEEFLDRAGGVFCCLHIIKDYEENEFGKIYTDISDPERVVNMIVYIIGEEIVYKLETLKKYEGKEVTEKIKEEIIEEIKQI